MSGCAQGGGGLIEAYVAVGSQTEKLNVDPADSRDRALVAPALSLDVAGTAVERVCSPPGDVDVIEQMRAHEAVIAGGILTAQPEELVEIERRRLREADPADRMQPHEFAVERNRRPAGRQSQHQPRIRAKPARDVRGQRACRGFGR